MQQQHLRTRAWDLGSENLSYEFKRKLRNYRTGKITYSRIRNWPIVLSLKSISSTDCWVYPNPYQNTNRDKTGYWESDDNQIWCEAKQSHEATPTVDLTTIMLRHWQANDHVTRNRALIGGNETTWHGTGPGLAERRGEEREKDYKVCWIYAVR